MSEPSSAEPLRPLLSRADILAHPNFAEAHEAFVDEMATADIHRGRRRGLNDFRQGVCFQLMVCFDAARDPSNPDTLFTTAKVILAMGQMGVTHRRAVAELVGRLCKDGYATVERAAHDRRLIEMRATEKAREVDREWLQVLFRPLSILEPDDPGFRLGVEKDSVFHKAFRHSSLWTLPLAAESMVDHPEADYFVQQSQGSRIMMTLMQAVRGREDRCTEPGFYARVAERCDVSHPHVRKIMRGAEERGLVKLSGGPAVAIEVLPKMHEAVVNWTAACMSTSHLNGKLAWTLMPDATA